MTLNYSFTELCAIYIISHRLYPIGVLPLRSFVSLRVKRLLSTILLRSSLLCVFSCPFCIAPLIHNILFSNLCWFAILEQGFRSTYNIYKQNKIFYNLLKTKKNVVQIIVSYSGTRLAQVEKAHCAKNALNQ